MERLPFLMYRNLFITTLNASQISLAMLQNARDICPETGRVNRWDAVTDGDKGSEIGQGRCA